MIATPTEAALALSQSTEISLVVKATAVLLIGLVSAALARRTRASVRHLLLTATFAALIATPIVGVAVPETAIAIPIAAVATPVAGPVAQSVNAVVVQADPVATTTPHESSRISWRGIAQLLWLTGVVLCLVPMANMLWKLSALRRTSLPWPELAHAVRALADERGFRRAIDVLQHEGVATPITFGVWRPVIVMPTGALTWSDADLRRALRHEVEHILRSDWPVQLIARAATAAYWFHPLAWVAWRQLALEAERSCDDAVVGGEERTDYADQLVTLAQRLSTTGPALGMAHRTDLAARIAALLDDTRPRGRAGLGAIALTIASAALMVLGLAPLRAVTVAQDTDDSQHHAITRDTETDQLHAWNIVRTKIAARTSVTVPVSYRSNGRVLLGDDAISLDALAERVRHNTHVLLTAEKGVLVEELVQVMERLKESGVEHVAIAETAEKPRARRALDRELLEAAEEGDLSGVKELIDAGADIDAAVDGDGSPLIAAARANRLAVVVELLDRGADINLAVSGDGNPLIASATAGAGAAVDLLLSRGAAIDLVVPGDENALIQAAGEGHFAIVKMLVDRGADVNARVWVDRAWRSDDPGAGEWRSPLSVARREGHWAIVEFLLQAGAKQ